MGRAVAPDLEPEILAQKVDTADAHAVEPARNLVRVGVKLTAGVKYCHDNLSRRAPLLLMYIGRDAAAVIHDRNGVIHMDRDLDRVAIAGKRLVNRIIDDLVNQMMKP